MVKAKVAGPEGPIVQEGKVAAPGRPLSVEAARERLGKLVQDGVAEKEPAEVEKQPIREREEEEEKKPEPVVKTADVDAPGSPASAQPAPPADDDDGAGLTEEEEKKARKAGFSEAIKWLAAWIRRQKEKLQSQSTG